MKKKRLLALMAGFLFVTMNGRTSHAEESSAPLKVFIEAPIIDKKPTLSWEENGLCPVLVFSNRGHLPISLWDLNSSKLEEDISFEAVDHKGSITHLKMKPTQYLQNVLSITTLKPGELRKDRVCIGGGWEGMDRLPHNGKLRLRAIYKNSTKSYSQSVLPTDPSQSTTTKSVKLWTGTAKSPDREFQIQ